MLRVCFTAAIISFFACSGSAPVLEPVGDGYKVSVRTNGEEVPANSPALVHRVSVSEPQYETLRDLHRDGNVLDVIRTRTERDRRGSVAGLRVLSVPSGRSREATLGLRQGDMITAFSTEHAQHPRELYQFIEQLREQQRVSMTVLRQGVPHKIYLSKNYSADH